MKNNVNKLSGNPILPGIGLCDPHIRIFNDKAYLYATHDRSENSTDFAMDDWWIWSSSDLVNWKHESTILPENTYYGKPYSSCWAVDCIEKNNNYFFYFSRGQDEIGVLKSDTPVGPWKDVLGKPLIPEGMFETESRDPGLFLDDDNQAYIVFGTWDFYIAPLNEDMISLGETPKKIIINNPEGPYGKGKTDDKPYLHKKEGIYYLSWGCFYGMSKDIYGPYNCQGSIIFEENIDPSLAYKKHNITHDRHGSFFEWQNQWYFICNEMGKTQNMYFRDSSISYVHYRSNGQIEPIRISEEGVSLNRQTGIINEQKGDIKK